MFWTDWGSIPRIERAGMDGTGREAIVTTNLEWPNGVSVDESTDRVFWVDARTEVSKLPPGYCQLFDV